jgi:hypothetical protein
MINAAYNQRSLQSTSLLTAYFNYRWASFLQKATVTSFPLLAENKIETITSFLLPAPQKTETVLSFSLRAQKKIETDQSHFLLLPLEKVTVNRSRYGIQLKSVKEKIVSVTLLFKNGTVTSFSLPGLFTKCKVYIVLITHL